MAWPARRRREGSYNTRLNPIEPAFSSANMLERKVVFYQADCKLNMHQLLEVLVPADTLKVLRAAYPFAEDKTSWYRPKITLNGTRYILEYNMLKNEATRCLAPSMANFTDLQPVPFAEDFAAMLERVKEVHIKFRQLRKVINWLNKNATLGACRYYFPSAASLLPTDHPFHSIGTRGYH